MSAVAHLSFEEKSIVVSAKLYFYGSYATDDIAQKIITEISEQYNAANGKVKIDDVVFDVKFDIDFEIVDNIKALELAAKNKNYRNNFIRIEQKNVAERSFMGFGLGQNAGHWLITDNLGESTTAAHEFGHGLGLDHPKEFDLRGFDTPPPIMAPRGTIVDVQFQWNPTVEAGEFGGTLKPIYRKVSAWEIAQVFEGKVFSEKGKLNIGEISNDVFDEVGKSLNWFI
jgi:hypothetical protein